MISNAEMLRRRKQQSTENGPNMSNFFDQLAMANNNWQASNRIISATYSANPKTGTHTRVKS